jgi:DNA-binding response OmpR family regulator
MWRHAPPRRRPAGAYCAMTTPTILVLDPHRELAEMAGEVLRARGFTVVVAARFEAGMEALDSVPSLRVAVCHATLPSEATEEPVPILSELALREDIALVVISSRPFEDVPGIPQRAVRLSKPFGAGELLDAIARASGATESAA